MAKGFKHSAGGTFLNFKVVAYATEEEQNAAAPKENTIGIITGDKITSWIFSATEPEAPIEGMVWFPIGTSSTVGFNALKKNGIMVYPISAKQYISGAWVDVTAKCYQNGTWNNFALIIFDGKAIASEYSFVQVNGDNGSITRDAVLGDGYVSTATSEYYSGLAVREPIDVTDRTVLEVTVEWTAAGSGSVWKAIMLKKTLGNLGSDRALYAIVSGTNIQTVKLDVSNLTGKYNFIAGHYHQNGPAMVKIYELKVH